MIIGICGGTGSGKTTIARKIIETVGRDKVALIAQDSYYRNLADMPLDERHHVNFDHPDSIDSELLANHIKKLRMGKPIEMPIYDFKTHTRSDKTERIEPKPVIIVEGILIFAEPKILKLLDVKIYVDTPDDIRFIRRLQRDIKERGRTVESVIEQYFASVRPMHFEFVEPSKRHADIIIPEGGNTEIGIELICSKIREKIEEETQAKQIAPSAEIA
ncbi:MAG: uridine kinase [Acidobacteria bacterium]|jgi:uridine kinase|nr:MAG: uridine kinase [Acidobacteriota bacterium]GIU81203.1 MAG: uridine kinase [Pyrinomonadaceae bacterium]